MKSVDKQRPAQPALTAPEKLYRRCKALLKEAVETGNLSKLDHSTNNDLRFDPVASMLYKTDPEAMRLDRQWTEMKAAQLATRLQCPPPLTVGSADILAGTGAFAL